MKNVIPYIWAAGGIHCVIAAANIFLPRLLDFRGNLSRVTAIIRQIFIVHSIYIVIVLFAFAVLCFGFAEDLAGGSSLGRCLSGFIAFFWGLRVVIQLGFYDRELRRQFRWGHLFFTGCFGSLAMLFTLITLGVFR